MPIIVVEDGSATNPNANSYISIADADAYLVPRGLWPVTPDVPGENEGDPAVPDPVMTAAKESALLRAADYLNTLQWHGQPVDWQRTMAWPRIGVPQPGGSKGAVLPDNIVPMLMARPSKHISRLCPASCVPCWRLSPARAVREWSKWAGDEFYQVCTRAFLASQMADHHREP